MHPAESPSPKFHKWQFVKRFGSDPLAKSWAMEYADLLANGRGRFVNASMPYEVWTSLAASTARADKARKLAEYLASRQEYQRT